MIPVVYVRSGVYSLYRAVPAAGFLPKAEHMLVGSAQDVGWIRSSRPSAMVFPLTHVL
jgi:hypothetical protein